MASNPSELRKRVLSGVAMIALALGALYLGGLVFWALVSLLALLMIHEWSAMMNAPKWKQGLALLLAAALMAYGLYFVDRPFFAAHRDPILSQATTLIGVAAILLAVVTFSARLGWGLLYVAYPALALVFLREQEAGLAIAVWTLVIVWATDIGAFFAGRAIGGPKLAPRLSPNKTWAGLIGGMIAALAVGAIIARVAALPAPFYGLGAPLAVAAQLGDLFESWLKRISGVKDSGRLLPGHGGVLDRLDGVVPVAVLMAAALATGLIHVAA